MGEKDKLTHSILQMVDGSMNEKSNDNVYIAVGIASFDNAGGAAFENHFIRRATSLNYKIFGVNEYLTSQMCPNCGKNPEFFGLRIKYCRNCHKFHHRDVRAGENMADELRNEL